MSLRRKPRPRCLPQGRGPSTQSGLLEAVRRLATRKIIQMWNASHGGLLYIRMKASVESYSQIALCSASVRFFLYRSVQSDGWSLPSFHFPVGG